MRARAEKVGGSIEVRSRIGAGTTIEVTVPIAATPAAVPAGAVSAE
jgi:signal transduction histidine kinase